MSGIKQKFSARRSRRRNHCRGLESALRLESLEPRCLLSAASAALYDIGAPTLTDIWVDGAAGNDANTGASRSQALRTVTAAWNRIPSGATLDTTGYRIQLVRGTYSEDAMPTWWDGRHGSYSCPIILQAADGAGTVTMAGMDVHDVRYMYLIGLHLQAGGGDVLHLASCDHILVRDSQLEGQGDIAACAAPQESLKVNQSQYVYVENNDISGAWSNAVDFVASQYGHVIGNKIHHSGDWDMYVKGGSAYLLIANNEIYDGGTGGFSAGQGTGFEFMVSPWLHYEAYDVKFVDNVIHDCEGAGIGVNGGYNILMAYNTMYRVGQRSHVIEVVHGRRACDGDVAQCQANLAAGGWGTTSSTEQLIPDKHVYIYDNIIYNPAGYQSAWQQFAIDAPTTPSAGTNIPSPSRADDDLQIRGNIIWNGSSSMPLGIEDVPGLTITADQLLRDNAINTLLPQLVDPAHGDYRPVTGGNVASFTTYLPPDFGWSDAPARPVVPQGNLDNAVTFDRDGNARTGASTAGAYTLGGTPPVQTSSDVAVAIAGPAGSLVVGSRATFSLTVTNRGPDAASGVTLVDLLSGRYTYVSVTTSQGTVAWSSGRLSVNLAALASGGTATITLVVTPTAAGTLAQSASVSSSTSDSNTANNTASLSKPVVAPIVKTASNGTSLAISATGTPTVVSRLPVSMAALTITGLTVTLNVVHNRDSDLTVTLIAPDGTRVLLVNRRGGTGRNFTSTVFSDAAAVLIGSAAAPFRGTYRPESPLSAFNGHSPVGAWRLEISDAANLNGGRLANWSLAITAIPLVSAPRMAAGAAIPTASSPSTRDAVFAAAPVEVWKRDVR